MANKGQNDWGATGSWKAQREMREAAVACADYEVTGIICCLRAGSHSAVKQQVRLQERSCGGREGVGERQEDAEVSSAEARRGGGCRAIGRERHLQPEPGAPAGAVGH